MNMKDMKSIGQRLTSGPKGKSGDGLVDASAIRELAELLKETGLTEIEIEHNGARLRVSKQAGGTMMAAPAPAPSPATAVEAPKPKGPSPGGVPSPMVGTVYASPE
ncbi:MAG: acetyl-CoA carboxylase biotin carboxyl carrier protein, partial [Rhizomicrobium sp.]